MGDDPRRKTELGATTEFEPGAHSLMLGGRPYVLVRSVDGVRLFSATCPHMGGLVEPCGHELKCAIHGWRFDRESGASYNAVGERLETFTVEERDGRYFAELPTPDRTDSAARKHAQGDVRLKLLAHAAFRFETKDFALLTDPWLWGPAFLGAWHHYPPYPVDEADTQTDAIFVTHEHSDHFHIPTLRKLDTTTPIFVPDFPNERMPRILGELGFENVTCMEFGRPYEIADDVALTVFEPKSWLNDALALIEIGGMRFLNANDAGMNPRIAEMVRPVDAVLSAFTPGASGYPLTWTHLDEGQKREVMLNACEGMKEMLRHAMSLYGARTLVPFAGHFALWHPTHREYESMTLKNTVDDIVRDLPDVDVIGLLPGESHDFHSDETTTVWRNRTRIYETGRKLRNLERWYEAADFDALAPQEYEVTREEALDYFERLNDVPDIAFCADLNVAVTVGDDASEQTYFTIDLTIRNGVLGAGTTVGAPALTMRIPRRALGQIVREGVSWDEAHIGYWCQFHREPDQYHASFWRLLQAPYYRRQRTELPTSTAPVSSSSVVGEVLEKLGEPARRMLGRYGLYCTVCNHASSETLAEAGRKHGMGEGAIERLVRELSTIALEVR